jgi:hypothetical protein
MVVRSRCQILRFPDASGQMATVNGNEPSAKTATAWGTIGILRADRASARTECPASRVAFTVSRPIPLLAPMIRTVATGLMLPVGPAWLTVMCDAGSRTARCAGDLKRVSKVVAVARRASYVAANGLAEFVWEEIG